jgi:predicted exporter
LTRNENAFAALRIAEQQGLIKGFQSLHTLLPSAAWQRTNFDAIRSEQTLSELKQALSAEGFSLESFRPFFEEQHEARFRALTLGDLRGTALGPWAERFVVQNPERTAVLSFPHLTRDPASLAQRLKPLPGVHFIDQRSLLDSAYTKLRQRVSLLVLLGAACMVLVIGLRFRNFRSSIATLVPALIAPTAALGALALLGVQLNLFHLFAALVVLSMAMDYGIFLSESVSSPQHLSSGGTLLSILVAGITSCLSFGLLGFSTVPVLAALGQTVGLGILTALAAAPLTLLLQRRSAALPGEA